MTDLKFKIALFTQKKLKTAILSAGSPMFNIQDKFPDLIITMVKGSLAADKRVENSLAIKLEHPCI
jgi:hypothetical protein